MATTLDEAMQSLRFRLAAGSPESDTWTVREVHLETGGHFVQVLFSRHLASGELWKRTAYWNPQLLMDESMVKAIVDSAHDMSASLPLIA